MVTQPAGVQRMSVSRLQRSRFWRREIFPWVLLAPALLLNIVVVLVPALSAIYFAFTDWPGLGPARWVGLANFQRMLSDEEMIIAFANNVRWLALSLTLPVGLALLVATLIASVKRGQKLFRAIFFLPVVLATVVIAQMWRDLYHPFRGLGAMLGDMGFTFAKINFLGDPNIALYSVYLPNLWHVWGFQLIIYLAALQQVDPHLYEAARMDGANRWQQFWHVSLPGIRPTLLFMLMISAIGSMLVFDFIYLMTQGGPGYASQVLAYKLFKEAFLNFRAGYASAIGLTVSLFCGVFVLIFITLRRRGWDI
jgi:raffinose/stachyose/melibiose transport system permease protein